MSAPSGRLTAIIFAGFVALLGCSKTQDTAPETRVFGDPPVIQSVGASSNTNAIATCDFTNAFIAAAGGGDWNGAGRALCDDHPIFMGGGVIVQSRYSEISISATVTDPNDPPPPGSDILLVSASYLLDSGSGTPIENTIVLFDDGSQIPFPFNQKGSALENCTFSNNSCSCAAAVYSVTSKDLTPADRNYTRLFAFAPGTNIPPNKGGLFLDCIAKDRGQASQIASDITDTQLEFRMEAVDRNGNLTESPTKPPASVGSGGLTCTGDPCACCLFLTDNTPWKPIVDGGCFGHPGLMFDPGRFCRGSGVPANLLNQPCTSDAQCGGVLGSCRQTPFGRDCPNGYCQSSLCLHP